LSRFFPLFACLFCASLQAAPDPFDVESGIAAPCPQPGGMAAPEAPLGLAEVIDLALCRNPKTRAAWANARIEASLAGAAQASYLPSLAGDVGGRRQRSRTEGESAQTVRQGSANLSLSYLLFDFGGRAANLENRRQLLNAAIAQQDVTRQAVFLEALQAFYQVHAQTAALEAAKASEAAAEKSFRAADARHRAEVATPADKLQAQTAFSQASLNRIRIEGQLRNAQGTLANVIGLDAHQAVRLEDPGAALAGALSGNGSGSAPDFSARLDALIAFAKAQRPDLAAAEARYQAAKAAVDVARSQGLPTLNLSAASGRQRSDGLDSRSGSLNVTLNIPLFTGFSTSYQIRAAEARLEASAIEQEQLAQQASLDVWQAWQALRTATQSLESTADLLASAEASERVALGRYQAGVGNILDVLNAQSALADARMQRIAAAYDWNINRAALASALGTLDKRLLDESFTFAAP
jgi:TolC family type I secretion outer membrane protein